MQLMRSLVVTASLLASAAAIAPAQQPTPTPSQTPAPAIHARKFGRGRHQEFDRALFRGITLSDAEKANVQAVHTKYASQMQSMRTQMRAESKNAKAARASGDTATLRSIRATEMAQRTQLIQAEQGDIRGALTPANQAKFDANVRAMQERASKQAFRKGFKKP